MAKIRFRAKAESDLDTIRIYSVAEFGRDVASHYLEDFDAAWALLAEYPKIGIFYGKRDHRAIHSLSCGRHRIFYYVKSETVWIVRILHQSMQNDTIMRMRKLQL